MTRARWLTGGLIGAGALAVAGEALASYVSGQLVVGIVSVIVLVGVLALGLASLARAHKFITRELAALGAQPPGGELYLARRKQALELRGRGVTPDLDVLADATAAQEAERGYTGKYLVATTVLIGLVGTFGGLMETLARMAPLLKGELLAGGSTLALIAGPLAGLHVTFGTSVVAIMVTLALALIQGDVTLRHERLLALLQERTQHVLVPELWPAQESAAERTVRALLELRTSVSEALATGAEANAAKISGVVRVEIQRLVDHVGSELRDAGRAQNAAFERSSAAVADSLRQAMDAAAQELRASATASRETLAASATALRDALTTSAAASHKALTTSTAAAHEALTSSAAALRDALTTSANTSRDALAASAAASHEALTSSAATLRDTLTASVAASHEALAAAAATSRDALTSSAAASQDALAAAAASVTATAQESDARARADAARLAQAIEAAATANGATLHAELAALAELERANLAEAVASTLEHARTTQAQNAELMALAVTGLDQAAASLATVTAQTSTAFTESTAAAVGALGELRGSLATELGGATQALSAAAADLDGSVRALAPRLAELAPQLGALATEVALLAARADTPEQPNAVLDELVRLGEDVERLVAANLPQPTAEDAGS